MKRHVDWVVVAGAALLAYANNLGNAFTYDDRFIIEHNPLVQELDWWGLVASSYWGDIVDAGLYRPLTSLTFGLNRLVSESALSFHLVNDALHAVASVLVLVAARALGASRFTALVAGLLFALHPVQTEAVNSIVGRAEILAFGLTLGAFIAFVRRCHPVWIGALFLLALCAKESAAFAVALFGLYWLLVERRNIVPIAAAVAVYAAMRFAVLGGFGVAGREIGFLDNPIAGAPLGERLLGALVLLSQYAKLTVWPVTLSADYSYNQIPVSADVRALIGAALVTGLVVLAWKKRGLVAFAALAFLVPLTGFLHIGFPLGTLFAERLMYLPMFGVVLLAALSLEAAPRRSWLVGALIVLSAVRVVTRNPDWRDNETLFRRTVQTSPQSARSHFLLGAELLEQKSYAEAAEAFDNGLSIAPQHVGARMSLGEARLAAGEPARALIAFEDALERAPDDDVRARVVAAALATGRSSARAEDWEAADHYFIRALELDPGSAEALNALGMVAERRGALDEARQRYEDALAIDRIYLPAIFNLASVRMATDELARAEELFRRAISLAPDSYEAYNGLGIALARQGRSDEAEAAFRQAVEIEPDLDAARDNLRALEKTP